MQQTGLILAIISALSFSIGIVIVRRTAAAAGESFSVMAFSVIVGLPFFAVAVTAAGDWAKVAHAAWPALALLCTAGVIHFILGRLLGYSSYRLIGANKATPFIMTAGFYTQIFSYFFLGESVTAFIIIGVLFMFLGAVLTSSENKSINITKEKKFLNRETSGLLLALATALCWGTTPVLIKPGVEDIGSSVAGAFISYAAAGVVLSVMLLKKPLRRQVAQLPLIRSIAPMALAGIFTAAGQWLAYASLGKSPANVVTPLVSVQVIFIFFLSLLINSRSEVFSWKVGLGMAATLAGTFFLFR
jgi:drug/metabolite transporter (DMT)-like permease